MIRNATSADVGFIYGLYMHPNVNTYLLYEPMPLESFEPIYSDLLVKGVQYVFENDSQLTGMCKMVPLTYRSAHVVYLGGIAIHPGFSGKGMGLQMMKEIQQQCKEKKYLRIELSVAVNNEPAIRLYKKTGFEEEGLLRKYGYLSGENRFVDEIMMSYLM